MYIYIHVYIYICRWIWARLMCYMSGGFWPDHLQVRVEVCLPVDFRQAGRPISVLSSSCAALCWPGCPCSRLGLFLVRCIGVWSFWSQSGRVVFVLRVGFLSRRLCFCLAAWVFVWPLVFLSRRLGFCLAAWFVSCPLGLCRAFLGLCPGSLGLRPGFPAVATWCSTSGGIKACISYRFGAAPAEVANEGPLACV